MVQQAVRPRRVRQRDRAPDGVAGADRRVALHDRAGAPAGAEGGVPDGHGRQQGREEGDRDDQGRRAERRLQGDRLGDPGVRRAPASTTNSSSAPTRARAACGSPTGPTKSIATRSRRWSCARSPARQSPTARGALTTRHSGQRTRAGANTHADDTTGQDDTLRLRHRRRRFGRVRARRAPVRGSGGLGLPARGRRDAIASPLIRVPLGIALLVPRRIHNWAFKTTPQPGLGGRRGYQPRGKTLGGSSAINAMVYTRGHRSDYDDWAALGNPGWSYADVLPYFRRAENNERIADAFHGQGGPLNVADPRSPCALLGAVARGGGAAGHGAQRGLQRRGAGRHRALSADAEERRALERGASLSHPQSRPAQPRGAHQGARDARRVRGQAGGRGRIPAGRRDARPCARGAR